MQRTAILALMTVGLSVTGCAGGYSYYAPVPPPPVRVEAYGPAPGPGFAWVGGYWGFRGDAYAWVPGYWGRPPRPSAVWEAGRWSRAGAVTRFAKAAGDRGRWSGL